MVTDSGNGTVFALWLSLRAMQIQAAESDDNGATFGAHAVAAGGNLYWGATLNGGVLASTVPMARYNWVTGRVCLVYSANGTSGKDVYYTYFPCGTDCNGYGWLNPKIVNDVQTNDQFDPAIDFNSTTGDLIIPFYDTRNDTNHAGLYDEYVGYMTSDGTAMPPNVKASAWMSDPTQYTTATGNPGFIGDYQDAWDDTYSDG